LDEIALTRERHFDFFSSLAVN